MRDIMQRFILVWGETSSMLDKARGGYFRTGEESHFPWDRESKEIWYAVFMQGSQQAHGRYSGFKSDRTSKLTLIRYLKMAQAANARPMLIGIWHGKWSTHLFVLDVSEAIDYLISATYEDVVESARLGRSMTLFETEREKAREKTYEERYVFSAYD